MCPRLHAPLADLRSPKKVSTWPHLFETLRNRRTFENSTARKTNRSSSCKSFLQTTPAGGRSVRICRRIVVLISVKTSRLSGAGPHRNGRGRQGPLSLAQSSRPVRVFRRSAHSPGRSSRSRYRRLQRRRSPRTTQSTIVSLGTWALAVAFVSGRKKGNQLVIGYAAGVRADHEATHPRRCRSLRSQSPLCYSG